VQAATDMAYEHLVRLHARGDVDAEPNRVVVEFAITGALDLAMRYFVEGRIHEIVENEADFTRAVIRAMELPVSRARGAAGTAAEAYVQKRPIESPIAPAARQSTTVPAR
jgi:hypothetical protein